MQHRDAAYLLDILEAAKLVVSFLEGISQEAFQSDLMRQSAVVRQIEIMGEAAKRLSQKRKEELPDIPWKKIAGMRDVLIHAYKLHAVRGWIPPRGGLL